MVTRSSNRRRPAGRRPRDRYGRPLPGGSSDELGGAGDAGDAALSIADAFDRAVERFDREQFFEAHEFFELIWQAGPEDERPFWKGLTQMAAGLCHCQRGNARGALALIARSAGYLGRFPSPYRGVDVAALLRRAWVVAADIQRQGASSRTPFFRFPLG